MIIGIKVSFKFFHIIIFHFHLRPSPSYIVSYTTAFAYTTSTTHIVCKHCGKITHQSYHFLTGVFPNLYSHSLNAVKQLSFLFMNNIAHGEEQCLPSIVKNLLLSKYYASDGLLRCLVKQRRLQAGKNGGRTSYQQHFIV